MYTPPPGVHEDMYNRGFLEGVVHAVPITVLSELHPQVIKLNYFSSFVQFKQEKIQLNKKMLPWRSNKTNSIFRTNIRTNIKCQIYYVKYIRINI